MKACRVVLYLFSLVFILFALLGEASGRGPVATHVVTIKTEPFALISLAGADPTHQTRLVVDGTGTVIAQSRQLTWTTNLEAMKVTVQSNLPADKQHHTLNVRAKDLKSNGTSTGWVTVTDRPSELIVGIARETGSCFTQYKAVPKNAKRGSDQHIITYTITQ